MSCRRISRELLERFRFGEELDYRSAPHLAHLAVCDACREEVGLDRALVRQLQRALRARVDGHEPSPRAFNAVRIRALAVEEPRLWTDRLVGWIRLAPAGALMVLMLVAVVGAVDRNQPNPLEGRTISWPGTLERIDNGPPTPADEAWWIQYRPAPVIPLPSSGVIVSVDPNPMGNPPPLPRPNTGFIE